MLSWGTLVLSIWLDVGVRPLAQLGQGRGEEMGMWSEEEVERRCPRAW